MIKALIFITFFAIAQAGCDNQCSGHGTCGQRGVCDCYDNWGLGLPHYSGDCSERICPFEFSWVDTPDKIGGHHKYAECSNRGICNRDSGECECFPGYEGKGCQRSACPNDCSGHGRCHYIADLPYAAVANDYTLYHSLGSGDFSVEDAHTFAYRYWDNKKTRGCVCDPEYGDVDCSKRMCQYGTDVMDQRDDMATAQKYQVQKLTFFADETLGTIADQTFSLTFKSKLNETFTTMPINYFSGAGDFHDFIIDIQMALLRLPNRVIDNVEVHGTWLGIESSVNITFTGDNVQGPQNLITVSDIECGDGCSPKQSGIVLRPATQNVTEVLLSDYNSYECGRRGKCDYTTGLCTCFAGYTGLSCNVITSLV